jgi:DNA-binding NtrC family response regulator
MDERSCMPKKILIVDPDAAQLNLTEYTIRQKLGYHTITAASAGEALQLMRGGEVSPPDLILIDVGMATVAGKQVLRELKSAAPQLPVVVLIPYGGEAYAGPLVAAGASDFLTKPLVPERLKVSIQNVLKIQRMSHHLSRMERKLAGHVHFTDIIGSTSALQRAISSGREAAVCDTPVWLEGEYGTGKELLARAIHGSSQRAGHAFVSLNCKTLFDDAAETVIFGRDAKPGTLHFILGKLREAHRGTLLLKDIGMLRPLLQHRLLDMLQRATITDNDPAGAIDVRLICSDNGHARTMIGQGHFSHILYQHLAGISIALPPLRDRRHDIIPLAKHLVSLHSASENKDMHGLTEGALQHLAMAQWPGNIRQLSHLLWRSVLLCNQEMLDVGDIRLIQQLQPVYYGGYHDNALSAASPLLFDGQGQIKKLKSIEDEVIRFALRYSDGCMTRAARTLGIGRSTLYRRVNELEPAAMHNASEAR